MKKLFWHGGSRRVLSWVGRGSRRRQRNTKPSIAAARCASWPARLAGRSIRISTTPCNTGRSTSRLYDGLVDFQKADGRRRLHVVAGYRRGDSRAREWRQDLHVQDPQGDQVLGRPGPRRRRTSSPPSSASSRCRARPPGTFYSVIVGADKCLADAANCTLEGGVVGDEAAGTVTINLTRAGRRVLPQARRCRMR